MASEFDDFAYPDPVQVDGMIVTRQRGIDPARVELPDRTPPQPIVQGDPEVIATRQTGNGAQRFLGDGTLVADSRAEDNTLYVDTPTIASGGPNQPPGIARITAPLMPSDVPMPPPPSFASDDGGTDPRAVPTAPRVITPEQVAVAKAAAKKAGK